MQHESKFYETGLFHELIKHLMVLLVQDGDPSRDSYVYKVTVDSSL